MAISQRQVNGQGLLVLAGQLPDAFTTNRTAGSALSAQWQKLNRLGIQSFVAGQAAKDVFPEWPSLNRLEDSNGVIAKHFAVPPGQIRVFLLDRAGTVRFNQTRIPPTDEVVWAAWLGQATATFPVVEAGKPAPDFVALDQDGKKHRLSDLRGRKGVLLTFFPRCFTGTCTVQLSSLRDSYPKLQAVDIEVWAVSVDPADGPRGQKSFRQQLDLPFTLLSDPQRTLCLLYNVVNSPNQLAMRQSIFIDKKGTVRWIDKQISPRTHGADVLARFKVLGNEVR